PSAGPMTGSACPPKAAAWGHGAHERALPPVPGVPIIEICSGKRRRVGRKQNRGGRCRIDTKAYIDEIEGRALTCFDGGERPGKYVRPKLRHPHSGRPSRGGNRNGKIDVRRIDVGGGDDDAAPLGRCGALLAVVFAI